MDNLDETKAIFLAKGHLNWPAIERVTDRYGVVNVEKECARAYNYVGQRGKLIVKVVGTRPVAHIGDLFRGFQPSVPEIGDILELGYGELFVEEMHISGETVTNIGLLPDDKRTSDWLNPDKLYQVHNQFVSLWFEPENA